MTEEYDYFFFSQTVEDLLKEGVVFWMMCKIVKVLHIAQTKGN